MADKIGVGGPMGVKGSVLAVWQGTSSILWNLAMVMALYMYCVLAANADPTLSMPVWSRPGMCGVNCLYVYAKIREQPIAYEALLKSIPVDPKRGCSLQDLADAAARFGVTAELRKISLDDLANVPTPFVAHFDLLDVGGVGHFVTVFAIQSAENPYDTVRYIDGTTGLEQVTTVDDFRKNTSGFVMMARVRWPRFPLWSIIGLGSGLGAMVGLVIVRYYGHS